MSLVLSVPVVPAGAQERRAPDPRPTRDSVVEIPEAMMPPAGKCRIWMLNVPAKQQPAATDCTTAMRQKPANAVLVFGPAVRDLSPFEARESWRRATEKDDDERLPTRSRTDRDSGGSSDEKRGRDDSAGAVPARRAESREAESRRAEPQKADQKKAEPKRPEPRKPEAQKVERRPSTSPKVERRPSTPPKAERRPSTPPRAERRRPSPTRTRTPPTPTKKPERP